MSTSPFPQAPLRISLRSALPANDQVSNDLREPEYTYVPPSHAKALHPERPIVEGIRGAGKSHWWAALCSPKHRQFLAAAFAEAQIPGDFEASQGYGIGLDPTVSPSKDILRDLSGKYLPRSIWQAVLAVHCSMPRPFPQSPASWDLKVAWIKDNPEQYEKLLFEAGSELARKKQKRLVVFDALDRLADDWEGTRPLARALLQLALDMLGNGGIRLKLFVRPDMLEDREILAFPDSSKILAQKVSLIWKRADLYALLFQCLANEPNHGSAFREHCSPAFGLLWTEPSAAKYWALPDRLRRDEDLQKRVFHALAGPTMSTGQYGHKRGFPYTWLVNHLVDSRDQVSPRSFFAALRSASDQLPPDGWPYALHYKAIQAGVQEASSIRVSEITREDYPWVRHVMEPLRGKVTVPCPASDIAGLWESLGVLEGIGRGTAVVEGAKLSPPHLSEGASGVLRDLKDLGVVDFIHSDRVQMPDNYRIAFGFGRKGGVKPLK